jgi:hypothetical protein
MVEERVESVGGERSGWVDGRVVHGQVRVLGGERGGREGGGGG